jgi:hypothetical protein
MKKHQKSRAPAYIATIVSMIAIIIAGCIIIYVIIKDSIVDDDNKVVEEIKEKVIGEEPQPVNGLEFKIDENLLRRIDFDELQSINPDVQRWIYVPNTNIDYYVMQEQTVNETYYLWRDINKSRSSWGSILNPAEPMDFDDAHHK